MTHSVRVLAILAVTLLVAAANLEAAKPLPVGFRHARLADAWKAARQSNRPIFLFVTMDGCHHCNKMTATTFKEPRVARALKYDFEAVVVHHAVDAELVRQLGVERFPTSIVALPSGVIVDRFEGFVAPDQLRKRLGKAELERYR